MDASIWLTMVMKLETKTTIEFFVHAKGKGFHVLAAKEIWSLFSQAWLFHRSLGFNNQGINTLQIKLKKDTQISGMNH